MMIKTEYIQVWVFTTDDQQDDRKTCTYFENHVLILRYIRVNKSL